jgi:PAS domain S-box-containing protein
LAGKKKPPDSPGGPAVLRRRAEASLRAKAGDTPDLLKALSPDALREMLHDLRVHQIELEMQNEELRAAQAALDTEKARYFDFYDLAPVGYLALNGQGLIKQANLTTASLLGVPRTILLKQPFSHFIDKADQEIFYNFRRQTIDSDATQRCELRIQKPDGQPFWVQLDAIAVTGMNGASEMRLVLTDIAERKQVALALATSENLFAQFMEALPGAAFIKAEEGATIYANRYMTDLVGGRDWLGKTAWDLLPPDIAAKMIADDRQALAAGSMVTEEQMPTPDGQLRHFRTHKFRILRSGQAPLLGGIALDISDLKQAKQSLVHSQEIFEQFMKTLPAIAFIKDESGTFVYANRYLEDFQGAGPLLGKTVAHIFPPHIAEKMIATDRQSMAAGQAIAEDEVPDPTGGIRFFQTHKFRIQRPESPPLLGGIALDITERKNAEQRLRSLAEELTSTVAKRTDQLRQLSAQLSMAEERERRELAQELHDNLIQLLYVIKIKLSLLGPDSPPTAPTAIFDLADHAERIARAITRKLSLPNLEELGLRGALESIVDDMSKTYNLNVTLSLKDSSQPLPIGQLAVLLRSVREILINVFKHAEVSEARISCQHLEDRLLICISDQGVGFDPEEVADDARGLPWTQRFGLRSLHERIANIFGTITIDSARGQGTRITLSIPHAPFTMDIPHS